MVRVMGHQDDSPVGGAFGFCRATSGRTDDGDSTIGKTGPVDVEMLVSEIVKALGLADRTGPPAR